MGLDAEVQHMGELENLSELAQARLVPAREAIAAAVELVAVAGGDVPVPCNVEPIPNWHLVDFHHPCLRRPLESYMEEFHQLKKFAAYPALSFVVLVAKTLALSSLPLVSAYPLRLLHAASFSSTLPHLATVAAGQVAVPWAG